MPIDWQSTVVIPLSQTRNQRVCSKYCRFTLLNLAGKTCSRVLERTIPPIVQPCIQEDPLSFHPGHGTLYQIYTFQRVFKCSRVKWSLPNISESLCIEAFHYVCQLQRPLKDAFGNMGLKTFAMGRTAPLQPD